MVDVSKKAAYLLCAAALTLGQSNLANAGPATQRPQPVIIDTDIDDDIDDAFALVIALQDPHLEVIGITTAWGDTRTRALLVMITIRTVGSGIKRGATRCRRRHPRRARAGITVGERHRCRDPSAHSPGRAGCLPATEAAIHHATWTVSSSISRATI